MVFIGITYVHRLSLVSGTTVTAWLMNSLCIATVGSPEKIHFLILKREGLSKKTVGRDILWIHRIIKDAGWSTFQRVPFTVAQGGDSNLPLNVLNGTWGSGSPPQFPSLSYR